MAVKQKKLSTEKQTTKISLTPLEDLKKHGKAYRGKKELIAVMKGEQLSASALILAHCYQCSGWYSDEGGVDCTCKDCALYQKMPYNKNKVKSKTVAPETIAKRRKTLANKEPSLGSVV
jgi:hypothetical protein